MRYDWHGLTSHLYYTHIRKNFNPKIKGDTALFILPRHLAIVSGIVLALALAVVLLAAALIRWVRRQRAKDARVYSPETDDPALLHAEIGRLQPSLLQIALDGADGRQRGWRESERAELRAGIEGILEEWAAAHEGLLAKLDEDRWQLLSYGLSMNNL